MDHNYRVDLYKLVTVGLVNGKNYLPLTGSNEWIRVQKTPEMILSLKSVVEPAESREVYLALTDLYLVSNHFSYVCYTHIKCLGRSLRKIKCQINLTNTQCILIAYYYCRVTDQDTISRYIQN